MEYRLIRSRRRTLGLEIKNAELIVRAPMRMGKAEIEAFIKKHESWIAEKLAKQQSDLAAAQEDKLSEGEIAALKAEAQSFFPAAAAKYAALMGVSYGKITIRCQKTRWGSCSKGGNLSFNCLLMLAPRECAESVVVHELAHRLHFDHSPAFYAEVRRVFPDYDRWNAWLKQNGAKILLRAK